MPDQPIVSNPKNEPKMLDPQTLLDKLRFVAHPDQKDIYFTIQNVINNNMLVEQTLTQLLFDSEDRMHIFDTEASKKLVEGFTSMVQILGVPDEGKAAVVLVKRDTLQPISPKQTVK